MPDNNGNLFLYEGLELRAEYQARIASLKEILPENRRNPFRSPDHERWEPVTDFVPANIREEIKKLEFKERKLNTALQQVNFVKTLILEGEEMTIAEALELRKSANKEIGDLQKMTLQAAYRRIIYKEERNITEQPDISYTVVSHQLEELRLRFRQLNRALRKVSFEIIIPFHDEK